MNFIFKKRLLEESNSEEKLVCSIELFLKGGQML